MTQVSRLVCDRSIIDGIKVREFSFIARDIAISTSAGFDVPRSESCAIAPASRRISRGPVPGFDRRIASAEDMKSMEIGIRGDMGTMEHRVRELKGDVGMLRERVAGLDQRVVHLDQRLSRLEIRFDEEFPPGAASGV